MNIRAKASRQTSPYWCPVANFGAPVCPTAAPQAGFGGGSRRPSCQVRLSKSGRKNRGIHVKTALYARIKASQALSRGTYCAWERQNLMRGAPGERQGVRPTRAKGYAPPAPRFGGLLGRIATKTSLPAKKKKCCTAVRTLTLYLASMKIPRWTAS